MPGQVQVPVALAIGSGATGGPLYLTKNAAGAPPYSFAGDTNTGLDSDGADSLILVTGGTTRLTARADTIASAGGTNVLISGTTSGYPALSFEGLAVTDVAIAKGGSALLNVLKGDASGYGSISANDFRASGTQVVGSQGAAVADASGGATIDAEARTAINTLLARIRAHGLIAT